TRIREADPFRAALQASPASSRRQDSDVVERTDDLGASQRSAGPWRSRIFGGGATRDVFSSANHVLGRFRKTAAAVSRRRGRGGRIPRRLRVLRAGAA